MTDREKLLEVLTEIRDDVDFEHEQNLVEDGLIDSLDLTRMIVALNVAFDIRIPSGEIEPENFSSADAILAMIRQYQKP